MKKENDIVMPGDILSTSEELAAGDGTFEEEGYIKASRIGRFVIDKKFKTAVVKPVTEIPTILKKNDIVIGEVRSVRNQMVIVDVAHVVNKSRDIVGDTNGTIHISEISEGYVKDASTEYKAGDIVRAKVIQVNPSLQLTTKEKNLGAIKSFCSICRSPLRKVGNYLECKNCGNKEKRKIASDYGEGKLASY